MREKKISERNFKEKQDSAELQSTLGKYLLITVVVLTYIKIFDTPPSTKKLNCPPLESNGLKILTHL